MFVVSNFLKLPLQITTLIKKMDTVTNTFSTKTIEEVKSLLLKTRSDSEKKKEELRQMVGER